MKNILAAALLTIATFPVGYSAELKIIQGTVTKTISSKQLDNLKKKDVVVIDPNESTDGEPTRITFSGYDGREVLDLAFGSRKEWTNSKTLTFECADGYRPELETKYFRKGGFYFAVSRKGSIEFSIINKLKDGKKAKLGPFYIVWTNPSMQRKEMAFYWPYQLVSIVNSSKRVKKD